MPFKLNHLHLKTDDVDKTAQFYIDTLGAKIVKNNSPRGYRLNLHGLELNVTGIIKEQTRAQKLGMEHIAIDSDEYDRVVNSVKARKLPILEETTLKDGRRACFFEGPDGVQLEFIEKPMA